MVLRELKIEDASLMYEWMHDISVVENLHTDFMRKTINDCYNFINRVINNEKEKHFAVVDENDTYMGTVSLRDIYDGHAEFAIVIRKCAMGTGLANLAMTQVLEYGFKQLELEYIYWCVDRNNKRALNFYSKNGYQECLIPPVVPLRYSKDEIRAYVWFEIRAANYDKFFQM